MGDSIIYLSGVDTAVSFESCYIFSEVILLLVNFGKPPRCSNFASRFCKEVILGVDIGELPPN